MSVSSRSSRASSRSRVVPASSSKKKKKVTSSPAASPASSRKKKATTTSRRASSSKKKSTPRARARSPSPTPSPPAAAPSSTKKRATRRSLELDEAEESESVTRTSSSASTSSSSSSRASKGSKPEKKEAYQFGGPLGVTAIATVFPVLMCYFWSCLQYNNGALYGPKSFTSQADWIEFFQLFSARVVEKASPTLYSIQMYIGYVIWSAILSYFMPGPIVLGMPVASLGGKQLKYNCNGYSSFYFTLAVSLVLNHFGIFKLKDIVDNFGGLMMTAIISGWFMSVSTYIISLIVGSQHRMTGNHIYDFFMGAPLNPRVGSLDLKMWSEIRVPWIILFYVSLSAVIKQWELLGGNCAALFQVPAGLWFTLLGHWIYVNACMKGEDCIPATWDIVEEKWGFMLIFWNMAGVPFTYCYNTLYLLKRAEAGNPLVLPWWVNGLLVTVLLCAYYVWDVAQAQKSHFRQQEANSLMHRWTFPQFPAGYLKNPKCIKTKAGSSLLIDGFWGVARKIHYTADFTMSMCWALICGFGSPLPYFYPFFFLCVLVHRVTRDMQRCAAKYGDDWKEYCKKVPYIFIPGVF